jgi:hypothetical protein
MARRSSRRRSRRQRGGEGMGMPKAPMTGGNSIAAMAQSVGQSMGMAGGRKRRSRRRGGSGVVATAAVPFGLLALQRFFKGSKTSKRGVRNLGSSFKRTFRRRR